ncbi:UNVERIFIED_CONTAM: hypothetical protein Slati_3084100 [Sesamum latifolium]|uniref:Integrase catalytic domain-containing protein n=1 Tax=Sesamum latifolium TaxID=2727402 RepID=A0AAW2UUE7_9LAMI
MREVSETFCSHTSTGRTTHYHVIPLSFRTMGIDIVEPFPLAPGQRKFLLVAIDYFTKWVEAEPLVRITEGEIIKFIWRNIICRLGLPREIIADNGRQFQGKDYKNCVKDYITTPRGSTGESPFTLVYGTKAIIPAELGIPSHRIMHFSEDRNNELLKESLDLLEELRDKACIRVQRYKNIMINAYNRRIKLEVSKSETWYYEEWTPSNK